MNYNCVCPFCNENFVCPDEILGVETECPFCKNKIVPYPDSGGAETSINSEISGNQEKYKEPAMYKEPAINTISVPPQNINMVDHGSFESSSDTFFQKKLASAITFLAWSIISLTLILFLIFTSVGYKVLKTEWALRRIFTEQKSNHYKPNLSLPATYTALHAAPAPGRLDLSD